MISEETLDKARIVMTTSSLRGDRLQNIIDVLLASGEVVLRSDVQEVVNALEIARRTIWDDLGTEISEIEEALAKFKGKRDA